MHRRVFFDLETTGFEYKRGDKILEIALVEVIDNRPTGRVYQTLVNPGRPIPPESTEVHGRTDEDVKNAPYFKEIAKDVVDFIRGAEMVAHNGRAFDMPFLNAELEAMDFGQTIWEITTGVVDTLELSRKFHPKFKEGGPKSHSLDSLMDHYQIDRTRRVKHEALIDTEMLVEVYLGMAERYPLESPHLSEDVPRPEVVYLHGRNPRKGVVIAAKPAEAAAHEAVLDEMEKKLQRAPVARQGAEPSPSSSRPRM